MLTIALAAATLGQGILSDIQANRANRRQARALREQAGIYDTNSALGLKGAQMYAAQAGGYTKQAKGAAELGRFNARNLRLSAGQLDRFEQLRLSESVLQARQRIGAGRAAFAGNGVLVDSGAAARWEQDEAADAALERLDIMQQFEDQSWTLRTQANRAEAEGYAAAAGLMGQAASQAGAAAGAAGQAYAAAIQAQNARSQADSLRRRKWYSTIGAGIGSAGGYLIGKGQDAATA